MKNLNKSWVWFVGTAVVGWWAVNNNWGGAFIVLFCAIVLAQHASHRH